MPLSESTVFLFPLKLPSTQLHYFISPYFLSRGLNLSRLFFIIQFSHLLRLLHTTSISRALGSASPLKKKSPTIHFEEPSQTESDDPATWLASFIYVCLNLLPPHRFVLANHPIHTNISCIGRKKQKENENEFDGTNRDFYHLLFNRQQPQSQYPPRTSAGHGVRRSAATTGTARNSKEK